MLFRLVAHAAKLCPGMLRSLTAAVVRHAAGCRDRAT